MYGSASEKYLSKRISDSERPAFISLYQLSVSEVWRADAERRPRA